MLKFVQTEVDIISDIDEYQTWPGLLVLACRWVLKHNHY